MKKTLFSLAFVAASGAYVAAANHLLPLPAGEAPSLIRGTALPAVASSLAPPAGVTPLLASSQPAIGEAAPTVAEVAPVVTSSPTPTGPAPTEDRQPPAAVVPPLPRPRPVPPASVQPAASSTDIAATSSSGYRDGSFTGSSENAYYGRVQVEVTVANHQITDVKVLDYPSDRRTSRYINSQALPLLQQEVIAADSADIDTVTGATLTSEAYIRSLGTALRQAGGAGA